MGIKDFFRIVDSNGKTVRDMGEQHDIKSLNKKLMGMRVAIDAPTILHAAVRGMPNIEAMTHNGKITSHLNVIFYNVMQFKRAGVDVIWVFDGKAPLIKNGELEKRKKARDNAKAKASKTKDKEKIKKLEKISYKLESYVYEDTKKLLNRMGVRWAIAPEEAEAYCSYLTQTGEYDYVWSMDADCFMFKASKIIRPTKIAKKKVFFIYDLKTIMKNLDVTHGELLDIGLCMGTDFSTKIRGIGPKSVIKKVKSGTLEFTADQKAAKAYFKIGPTKKTKAGLKVYEREDVYDQSKLCKFLLKRGFNMNRLAPHIQELTRINKV